MFEKAIEEIREFRGQSGRYYRARLGITVHHLALAEHGADCVIPDMDVAKQKAL